MEPFIHLSEYPFVICKPCRAAFVADKLLVICKPSMQQDQMAHCGRFAREGGGRLERAFRYHCVL